MLITAEYQCKTFRPAMLSEIYGPYRPYAQREKNPLPILHKRYWCNIIMPRYGYRPTWGALGRRIAYTCIRLVSLAATAARSPRLVRLSSELPSAKRRRPRPVLLEPRRHLNESTKYHQKNCRTISIDRLEKPLRDVQKYHSYATVCQGYATEIQLQL